MPRLPRVSASETIKALESIGFRKVRQKGSHVFMKRFENEPCGCVVPLHKELAIGTLKSILRQAGVSIDDFIEKLK